MAFNITEFQGHINRRGIQKASLFDVIIIPGLKLRNLGDAIDLNMRATSAELPGRTVSTTEYRVYGPVRKMPYASTYTDTRIEFLCTEGLKEKLFFEKWQNAMLNTNATNEAEQRAAVLSGRAYNVEYYNDYKGVIVLRNYNEVGELTIEHKFIEAYPLGIAPLALSWDSGELLKLSVTFAFHDYIINT